MNKLIVFICLIVGSFQVSNACNTCQNCIPTLAEIMQEIDSDASDRNILPSQIQVVISRHNVDVKVQTNGITGWNKRSKGVLWEKYKKCQKTVEDANLKLPSANGNCDLCRKECRNIRFYPTEQIYVPELRKYQDIFEYKSRKDEFVCGQSKLPVLEGTLSTSPTRMNALEPGKDVNNGNVKNSVEYNLTKTKILAPAKKKRSRRRLFQELKSIQPSHFEAFKKNAAMTGICGEDGKSLLSKISQGANNNFQFSCLDNREFCKCLSKVGGKLNNVVKISNNQYDFILKGDGKSATYQIKNKRRRRLFQRGSGGKC
jgi:hypothetical protein